MPLNMQKFHHQAGLTLIELMVSVALGIFVLAGLVYVTSSTMRTNTQTLRSTHLNQELRAAMHLITRDMRRAGGITHAAEAIKFSMSHSLNLDKTSGTDITITASDSADFDDWVDTGVLIKTSRRDLVTGVLTESCIQITGRTDDKTLVGDNVACRSGDPVNAFEIDTIAANSWIFANVFATSRYIITDASNAADAEYQCILFGYDKNDDGVADAGETFGYKFDSGAIKAWKSGNVSCISGTWEPLTDEDLIEITGFSITRISPLTSTIPEYKLAIAGKLIKDTSVQRTIEDVVRMRNDATL